MTLATVAVVGAHARPIGDSLARVGEFIVAAAAQEFMELIHDAAFPTQYLVLAHDEDRDATRARIGIAHSLGVRVILVPAGEADNDDMGAEFVIQDSASSSVEAQLHAIEQDRRHQRRSRRPVRRTTLLTAREKEACDLRERLGSVREVADELGVSYNTAATFLKRATRKLELMGGASSVGYRPNPPRP